MWYRNKRIPIIYYWIVFICILILQIVCILLFYKEYYYWLMALVILMYYGTLEVWKDAQQQYNQVFLYLQKNFWNSHQNVTQYSHVFYVSEDKINIFPYNNYNRESHFLLRDDVDVCILSWYITFTDYFIIIINVYMYKVWTTLTWHALTYLLTHSFIMALFLRTGYS